MEAGIVFSSDAADQNNVARHDGHPLRVERREVDILEETDEIRLCRFLERADGGGLEAKVTLHGKEGKFSHQKT